MKKLKTNNLLSIITSVIFVFFFSFSYTMSVDCPERSGSHSKRISGSIGGDSIFGGQHAFGRQPR